MFDLGVVLDGVSGHFVAVARFLTSRPRHFRSERELVIDPDRPELKFPRCVERPADIAGPDGGGEAVAHFVRPRKRLGLTLETLNRHHGPENLVLDDLIGLIDVNDDAGFDEEAAHADRFAAGENPRRPPGRRGAGRCHRRPVRRRR